MNKRHLYPKNWQSLRLMVIIRDKFCCTICGIHQDKIVSKKGKLIGLHVMHLDGNTFNNAFSPSDPVFNNPNNNLASGCPSCHKMYDKLHNNQEHISKKENHQVIDLASLNMVLPGK
jgi:5-methylcytosine-specific restriction endonuclease McrA